MSPKASVDMVEAVVDMAGTSLVKYRWEVEGAVST